MESFELTLAVLFVAPVGNSPVMNTFVKFSEMLTFGSEVKYLV